MSDQLIENIDLSDCFVNFNEAVQWLHILDRIKDKSYFDQSLEAIIDSFC